MANKGHDNLIPAKPGDVRNPGGKPKGTRNRSTIVREMLEAKMTDGRTYAEAMTAAIMEKGLNGDVTAWDKLFDSAWGKVSDKTEITGADGGPIETKELSLTEKDIIQRYLEQQK